MGAGGGSEASTETDVLCHYIRVAQFDCSEHSVQWV